MEESLDVRLARIEERLNYAVQQLEKLMVEFQGVAEVKRQVTRYSQDISQIQRIIYQARGMVLIVSAMVAFVAALIPEILIR